VSDLRLKRQINVHIFNSKGEESVVPFVAVDWNTTDNEILEVVDEDDDGNEVIVAHFHEWTYVEFK